MGKNIHITPRPDGQWNVIVEGNTRATAITNTQAQAIEIGRLKAIENEAELLIHGLNSQIREKNSYGNDPNPPKG